MIQIILENVPNETQDISLCTNLKWVSHSGHPYLQIYNHEEYTEIDLLQNRPISVIEVKDSPQDTELKLFDFLFSKNIWQIYLNIVSLNCQYNSPS